MHDDARTGFAPYTWPQGQKCALVFSLDLDAESPYHWVNRKEKPDSLGELEQRRYGPRQGVARILELLRRHEVAGSFFVPGTVAATYPDLLPMLVAAGHEIGYHGYFHERLDAISADTARDYLQRTVDIFRAQTGLTGLGYRSPSWEHSPDSFALLKGAGVSYDSSLMGFDHPYDIDGVTEVPVQWTTDDALYFRYTNSARDKTHPANPNAVLESWIEELEAAREWGGLCMVTVHDWVSGRPQRLRMLEKFFQHARSLDGVWWATAGEVAAYHRQSAQRDDYRVAAHIGNFAP